MGVGSVSTDPHNSCQTYYSTHPGGTVRIDWPVEEEKTRTADTGWNANSHKNTLSGAKHGTGGTETNARQVRGGIPVQITLCAC
jgi:hypothetical protein